MYVTESLRAYLKGLMFSSAVMLGVASEKAFNLLLEALTDAIKDQKKKRKFTKLQDNYKTKYKFDEVKKEIYNIEKRLSRDIRDTLKSYLEGIFHLIRISRNDAGHPTGRMIERDHVFVNLRLFIPYCKTVYRLIDYFQNNQI